MPAMASARCQRVRGVCIAGKPGPYRLRGLCWSWLACDGLGGVSVSSRRLHRGQARPLQAARALLELACLRWPRRGASECAASASRARPNPTAGAGPVGAGLPAIASARCQRVRGACIAGKPGSYRLAQGLLELACLRWRRRGASECAVSASRAIPAPTGCAGSVGAGLPAMASVGCQWVRGVCIAGKPGSYSARSVGAGLPAMASARCPRVRGACIAGKPGSCWSWLACDGLGGVSASSRRLHRGQARFLLELACLRWPRWGASEFAAFASRASPAPTGCTFCWSWLACDGLGAVLVSSRRLHRGQARLPQLARGLLELACLR
ncbi:hypothetical protein AB7M23_002733 [Pseudomonas sp. HLS-6 TE3448]